MTEEEIKRHPRGEGEANMNRVVKSVLWATGVVIGSLAFLFAALTMVVSFIEVFTGGGPLTNRFPWLFPAQVIALIVAVAYLHWVDDQPPKEGA